MSKTNPTPAEKAVQEAVAAQNAVYNEIHPDKRRKPTEPNRINPATGRAWKSGGRKPGQKNNPKIALIREMKKQEKQEISDLLDENTSALAMLIRTYNDTQIEMKLRIDAARATLPYLHGKKPNLTEITGRDGRPIEFSSAAAREQLQTLLFEGTDQPILEYKDGETLEHDEICQLSKEEQEKQDKFDEMRALTAPLEEFDDE